MNKQIKNLISSALDNPSMTKDKFDFLWKVICALHEYGLEQTIQWIKEDKIK